MPKKSGLCIKKLLLFISHHGILGKKNKAQEFCDMDINHLEKFKNTIASGKTGNGALTGAPLEVMSMADSCLTTGGFDVIAHCRQCTSNYEWYRDSEGNDSEMKRYFFG